MKGGRFEPFDERDAPRWAGYTNGRPRWASRRSARRPQWDTLGWWVLIAVILGIAVGFVLPVGIF